MKKHFEQAIAFDRDNPLNQRTGLGKKYNELVDEYNALEEKYNKETKKTPTNSQPVADSVDVADGMDTTPATGKSHKK